MLEMETEQTFPTETRPYIKNIEQIIIRAQTLSSTLSRYEEIEGELGGLMYSMEKGNIRDIRVDVLKWYRAWALNSIAQMESEIAELKKRFEAWL